MIAEVQVRTRAQRGCQFNVYVSAETFDAIEKKRGLVKRSTFVSNILDKALGINDA